jgi:hypothetical protein
MLVLADIEDHWPRVGALAEAALAGDDYTPDNLRLECRENRALCFASSDGVAVVTLVPNRLRNDLELVVLLAASVGPHGAVEAYLPSIERVARDLGAARIVFRSRRRGWLRHLPEGWALREVTYVCEVRDEQEGSRDSQGN